MIARLRGPTDIAEERDHEPLAMARACLSIGVIDVLRGRQLKHHFAPHMHEFFAIGLIDHGHANVRYRGVTSSASRGTLVTITAGEIHTGGPAGPNGWSYRMMYPEPGLIGMALDGSTASEDGLLFKAPYATDAEVARLFRLAHESLTSDECTLAAEERVLRLLRALFQRHSSPAAATSTIGECERIANLARDYLEAHFTEHVRLSTLSSLCGVSPFHFIRLFGRRFGIPPHAYLKQIRIARALEMLRHGVPVGRVAHRCGFSDQSHFTRNFKRTFGVSPGRYQRGVGVTTTARSAPAA